MPKKAKSYIALTIAAGSAYIADAIARADNPLELRAYLVCVVIALLMSTLKVRLPGMTSTISVNFLMILIAIGVFTLAQTVLLASLACVVQCVWKALRRPKFVQVAFNIAVLATSSGFAYQLSHRLVGSTYQHDYTVLLAVASCLYFATNTLLVSGVLAMLQDKPLLPLWRQCHMWSFPYYLVGASVAGLVLSSS